MIKYLDVNKNIIDAVFLISPKRVEMELDDLLEEYGDEKPKKKEKKAKATSKKKKKEKEEKKELIQLFKKRK